MSLSDLAKSVVADAAQLEKRLSAQQRPQCTLEASGYVDVATASIETQETIRLRNQIVQAAYTIVRLAQGPVDHVVTLSYNALDAANLEALLRMGVPQQVPLQGTIPLTDLATLLHADLDILTRLVRFAITNGIFIEDSEGYIGHSAASATLAWNGNLRDVAQHNASMITNICANISPWEQMWREAKKGKTCLGGDRLNGHSVNGDSALPAAPFNLTYPGYKDCFEFMALRPEKAKEYYNFLDGRAQLPRYSARDLLSSWDWKGRLGGSGTLVDVGGSSGQIAGLLAAEVPNAQFIVQDTNEEAMKKGTSAIASARLSNVTFHEHDFFAPQSIRADVYYFRNILHDWSDEKCVEILRALEPALSPGSTVLINEVVLPEPPAQFSPLLDQRQARIDDLVMMGAHNARERSLKEFENIFLNANNAWSFVACFGAINNIAGIANSLLEFQWH
ncbi:uncharacterized protein MYCFIDRAFT_198855 [Pseudocercospora fijiensis CIRAD86]|uniref:O-methyltransferase C-terminal domain-containing protein n=1 Tax=Pseudocercospora fijiensis (strain CIRAD86) TaxID=383855 RepID=M2YSK7_PSEFD|nr:uncharacterized protein MYCFIDRAFT_198855 [Pseudocercospora fijiensis CIRAD86]EME80695.1 hypothetical protein MYCFIDRAFT_198855 [Pseudocercospora fijiensis CIRAD86]